MNDLETFIHLFVSRSDDFAVQRSDGGYARVGRSITPQEILAHLAGHQTMGVYVRNEQGYCTFAVFDADTEDGMQVLQRVQAHLATMGIVSYLEQSRRGAHLWVFLAVPVLASVVRSWLLPVCPSGIEFYPKQNEGNGYGSLIRLPLGIHKKSGKRYPFVQWTEQGVIPVAPSMRATLKWFSTVQRVIVPEPASFQQAIENNETSHKETSFSLTRPWSRHAAFTIRDWCASHDPYAFIGRYVSLNSQGIGCCPFGWHHTNGYDTHASFKVYAPGVPGGYCWYCHVWQQGGSLFDFLRYYRNLDARTLWYELQEERTGVGGARFHTTERVTRGVLNTLPTENAEVLTGGTTW